MSPFNPCTNMIAFYFVFILCAEPHSETQAEHPKSQLNQRFFLLYLICSKGEETFGA